MKNIIISVLLMLGFSTVCFTKPDLSVIKPLDSPLGNYELDESWEMQRQWLYQLALAMKRNPKAPGYIHYSTSEKHSLKQVKAHINRAMKFLTQELSTGYRIKKSRLVFAYDGKEESARVTFWIGYPRDNNK